MLKDALLHSCRVLPAQPQRCPLLLQLGVRVPAVEVVVDIKDIALPAGRFLIHAISREKQQNAGPKIANVRC